MIARVKAMTGFNKVSSRRVPFTLADAGHKRVTGTAFS